jgi:hypothetical protein
VPPCPSWIDTFNAHRPPLRVYVFDGVSGSPSCSGGQSVHVTVYLDEQPVGTIDVPCLAAAVAPAPFYRLNGGPVAPGMHELRVDAQTTKGVVQGATLLSLPAFDFPPEGQPVVGAEIAVGLGPADLAIGPPQVYPPKMP